MDGKPGAVFEDLQADGCCVLLQDGEGAAVGVRGQPQNEVRPRTWRVVVHPHSLHGLPKHLVEEAAAEAEALGDEAEQCLT